MTALVSLIISRTLSNGAAITLKKFDPPKSNTVPITLYFQERRNRGIIIGSINSIQRRYSEKLIQSAEKPFEAATKKTQELGRCFPLEILLILDMLLIILGAAEAEEAMSEQGVFCWNNKLTASAVILIRLVSLTCGCYNNFQVMLSGFADKPSILS
ncbi:hypothetical protein OIU77_025707 [Salix suchowensis]|uniref:Uncharacterized protein n=1 Tax=Salix suchowensis TaxID=1278906 RepID=A0ABQ9BX68_9ROSI|nr:hypothetical protein OIU77_025707 [Salix suchowensis]